MRGKEIQQPGPACCHQVRLAAATASVCRIPRAVPAALFSGMPELSLPLSIAIARVVVTGVIHPIRVCPPIGLGSRQDVVLVRHVPDPIYWHPFFRQRELFTKSISEPRLFNRVAM